MARGRTTKAMVRRWDEGRLGGRVPDQVLVEEPMEIRLDDTVVATTMRTPGHDYELAVGFCHTEGLLAGFAVVDVRYCALGAASDANWNVVSVSTGGQAPEPAARLGVTTAACGWCGSDTIDDLATRWPPLEGAEVDWGVVASVGDAVSSAQELFDVTGGAHAAAAFDLTSGDVLVVREDIGRHNAMDKVIGRLLLDGRLPAGGLGLWASSRLGYELVAKAWSAGFGAIVAVGPASSLAVDTARRANLPAAGFARNGTLAVYD
jgi:FdhD protein